MTRAYHYSEEGLRRGRSHQIALSKARGFWNAKNDAKLHRLWAAEYSARQIEQKFGPPVTRNMVIGRLWRVRNGAA